MDTQHTRFTVLYRWRLHPGAESSFIEAWSRLTKRLKAQGAFGSRLHRGADGLWYAYAQWPNNDVRQSAFAQQVDPGASQRMRAAIAEGLPEVELEVVADYLDQSDDRR